MRDTYPRLLRTHEKDQNFWRPLGWKGRFYKLFNSLRFTRKTLHLSDDLFVIQTELIEGNIRVGGVIGPGRLSIGFYESLDGNRLSGAAVIPRKMTVSYNGCKWDAVSKAPAYGLVIDFSPALTERIVSKSAHSFLMEHAHTSTGERLSLVSAVTPVGENLRTAIRSTIELAEQAENCGEDTTPFAWISDDLVSMATCLIDEIAEQDSVSMAEGEANRYRVAREIEQLLWRDPAMSEGTPSSLDEFAAYFDCSRRYIQMAVQEHFGVGFTALKRSIRLQQVNAALETGSHGNNVTSVATAHEFDHLGRFAQYYREMFGALPSKLKSKPQALR